MRTTLWFRIGRQVAAPAVSRLRPVLCDTGHAGRARNTRTRTHAHTHTLTDVHAPTRTRTRTRPHACAHAHAQCRKSMQQMVRARVYRSPRLDYLTTWAYCRSYILHKGRTNGHEFMWVAVLTSISIGALTTTLRPQWLHVGCTSCNESPFSTSAYTYCLYYTYIVIMYL